MQRQSLTTLHQQTDAQPVAEQQLLWNSSKCKQLVKQFPHRKLVEIMHSHNSYGNMKH